LSSYIHCENTECKHYFEDNCILNLDRKMICIDREGKCESFEQGKNEGYVAETKESEG